MSWIPGWDSIASAGMWSGFYFWMSIGALIGLGVFEVASHRYSERKDEMVAVEQEAIQRRHDEDMTRVQHDAARLSAEAELLRQKNLAFEAALAPRTPEQGMAGRVLREFSDVEVLVTSFADAEPRRTAAQIRFMLLDVARWKQFRGTLRDIPFLDGVTIHTAGPSAKQNVQNAAAALVKQLQASGISAQQTFPVSALGDNAILVQVGLKPLPPILSPKEGDIPADSRGNKMYGNMRE
jgi:hypothetical protein